MTLPAILVLQIAQITVGYGRKGLPETFRFGDKKLNLSTCRSVETPFHKYIEIKRFPGQCERGLRRINISIWVLFCNVSNNAFANMSDPL